MASESPQLEELDNIVSTFDKLIQVLDLAKDARGIPPAQAAFASVSALLTAIRDSMVHKGDYVKLGLECADICQALDRGLEGRRLDQLSQSVLGAIQHLTTTVAGIKKKITKRGERSAVSRFFRTKSDKDTIAAWSQDLSRILQIFNTELLVNIHIVLSDGRHNASMGQEDIQDRHRSPEASVPLGESPPPPPRTCFGREVLISEIISLAENLEPIALIGVGGIGKTSVALTVLHHNRIKERFGSSRRFIRCDQFPASRSHFLARLSKVIGAGIENPEDLASLRPHLSSREMILFLDNAESILDPQGTDAQDIYSIVDELSRFNNICLGITSRIFTVPPHCKRPTISTLSMESALDIFYAIYNNGGRSNVVNDLVKRLDFHPLSITLLATTASHNTWSYDRLAKEWDTHHAQVLRTDFNESLAATIELSLASPTFRKLSPDARELLGIVAFFPQGVDENNLDWLFPTIPDRRNTFDKFCVLSLTSRTNNFITMLAPIRDYLCPKDPQSSPLLCETKDRYCSRLRDGVAPGKPGFAEMRWIVSEDVNAEHLLSVFISIDVDEGVTLSTCPRFIDHLYWHKPRQTLLKSQIEALPDDHDSKSRCLLELARLSQSLGNFAEQKRLLSHALKLEREKGDEDQVGQVLVWLSEANRYLGLFEEGIRQGREALEIYERLDDVVEQGNCLSDLAFTLFEDGQLDAAEGAASRAIDLLPETGEDFLVCKSHRFLGDIYSSKGERGKAIHHYEVALGIASSFNWPDQLFFIHDRLARLSLNEGEFDDARAHIEQAKLHVAEDEYLLGRAADIQAQIWHKQGRLEEAASDASRAIEIYEKLGAGKDLEECKGLVSKIELAMRSRLAAGEPDPNPCSTPPDAPVNTP